MLKMNESPGSLAGAPGGCVSPHGTSNYSVGKTKKPSLPLRVSREDIDNLPPLEKAYAEYLIETKPGEVFVVVNNPAGD